MVFVRKTQAFKEKGGRKTERPTPESVGRPQTQASFERI